MGSDDLFHKKKAKSAKQLQRRQSRRAAYEKLLIVCEGEKTEPHYFNGIRNYYDLNTANVEISGDCNSDPMSLVDYAKQRYREERDSGDPFDRIFCVFDKDAHTTYVRALDALHSANPDNTFFAINSVPCFEYWLLLHFQYSTKSYTDLSANSAGNQVINDLKNFMPDYEKGGTEIFAELFLQLDFAKNNAARALGESEKNGTDNPSTHIHTLVEFMQNLKPETSL